MKKTLLAINSLLEKGIISKYAIAGGIAHFYYIEPSVTFNLDLVVSINSEANSLAPLSPIYDCAKERNYPSEGEHLIIEGIPVRFLLAYNPLVSDGLDHAVQITVFEVNTFIFEAEYLMAIMLQTGRPSDNERLIRFLSEAEFDSDKLNSILEKHNLMNKYIDFRERRL